MIFPFQWRRYISEFLIISLGRYCTDLVRDFLMPKVQHLSTRIIMSDHWHQIIISTKRKNYKVIEIYRGQDERCNQWLECNLDPKKTAAVIEVQKQMVETRTRKAMRGEEVMSENCGLYMLGYERNSEPLVIRLYSSGWKLIRTKAQQGIDGVCSRMGKTSRTALGEYSVV